MAIKENPHHLVMGELIDFLTGKKVSDTHDERYRQKIARLLVEKGGYEKSEIISNQTIYVHAGKRKATLKIDFIVRLNDKTVMMIKYAPGSLVTRRLSTLALSRVIESYQIPYAVISNGEGAEILDGVSGQVIAQGLECLPSRDNVIEQLEDLSFSCVGDKLFDQASRIAYACEIDGACPCDSDICVIE